MTTPPSMVEQPRDPMRPWAPSPFKRLARTHALSVAGDAIFTTAMAGLVFFNVSDLGQARWRVAMALLFTILPFSVAAPFIGPLIDRARGGRKWMIVGLSLGRAIAVLLLVWNRDSAWALYPEFLLALVCAKGYVIAKGALVPTTVHSDRELVQANAKLSAISGVAAIAGGAPSLLVMGIASKLGSDRGPDMALVLAAFVYLAAIVQAAQLPSVRVANAPADEAEITELRTAGIRHAAQALALTRGTVGFLTFLLAFHFKDLEVTDSTASKIGLIGGVVGGQVGFMVGAAIAPPLRKQLSEERMLMTSLGVITLAGLLTALMGDLAGATLLAFAVGITANTAKQAFDSIVQRDAPDANRGRAFAKFETRFQLMWVIGALAATLIGAQFMIFGRAFELGISIKLGFLAIALCSGTALTLYFLGLRDAVAESKRRPTPLSGEPALVEPQPASRSFLRRRPANRLGTGPDPTVISVGDRAVAPSGIDSTMVVAPATVSAAPMASTAATAPDLGVVVNADPTVVRVAPVGWATQSPPATRPDASHPPRGQSPSSAASSGSSSPSTSPPSRAPWRAAPAASPPQSSAPRYPHAERPGAPSGAPGDPAGLFGAPDAPIPDALVDPPDAGLFAVDLTPQSEADPVSPGAVAPVFYDGSQWIDEDDTNPGPPRPPPPTDHSKPRDPLAPPLWGAPGQPVQGLPLPAAPPIGDASYATPPRPTDAPGDANAEGDAAAPGDDASAPTPPPPRFVNPDGSYPEPPWRDGSSPAEAPTEPSPRTPPLPGFE